MPHHKFSDDDIITIKLDNGYNIGIAVDKDTKITLLENEIQVLTQNQVRISDQQATSRQNSQNPEPLKNNKKLKNSIRKNMKKHLMEQLTSLMKH